jgi:hypothetical protein
LSLLHTEAMPQHFLVDPDGWRLTGLLPWYMRELHVPVEGTLPGLAEAWFGRDPALET